MTRAHNRHRIGSAEARHCRFCGEQPDMECVPPRAPGDDDTYFVLSHNCAAENYRADDEDCTALIRHWNATQCCGQTLWFIGGLAFAAVVIVGLVMGLVG